MAIYEQLEYTFQVMLSFAFNECKEFNKNRRSRFPKDLKFSLLSHSLFLSFYLASLTVRSQLNTLSGRMVLYNDVKRRMNECTHLGYQTDACLDELRKSTKERPSGHTRLNLESNPEHVRYPEVRHKF